MAMDPMDREPNVYNRETNVYDNTKRGSNTLAYVIGGLVVALGLLAFLFYDGGSNEPSTTGSTVASRVTLRTMGLTSGSGPFFAWAPARFVRNQAEARTVRLDKTCPTGNA
jgi:hypothetical protein